MINKGEWSSEKSDQEGGSEIPNGAELELNPIPSSLAPPEAVVDVSVVSVLETKQN